MSLIIISLWVACKSDPPEPAPEPIPVRNLSVIDMENAGDGSDLWVSFNVSTDISPTEYRIMVVKEGAADAFDLTKADALGNGLYFSQPYTGLPVETFLSASSKDADGELIKNDLAYQVFVLAIFDARENILSTSVKITLKVTNLVKTITGSIPGGSGGMETDRDGNIYMADFGVALNGAPGTKVFKVTPSGEVSTFATGLFGASGNAMAPNGDLYQSNIAGNSISRISPEGTVNEFVKSGVSSPVGVILDDDGNLYVANCGNNTISKVTPSGSVRSLLSSTLFNCPNGIARDPEGNLYVANFGNGNVIKVDTNLKATIFATFPGNNNGHITYVKGELYVVDRGGNQIFRLGLDGQTELIAGSGGRGRDDGAALSASFSLPNDLSASLGGDTLYVNDVVPFSGNNISPVVIRAIMLEE